MADIIDYLADELKKQEATKTRKAGKKARMAKMLCDIKAAQPAPLVDLLAVLGD
jgi:hypothetical protein